MSWKESFQGHREAAIDTVRVCVAALRARGVKSEHALTDLAPVLGTTARRIRTLFYRDGEPVVLAREWDSLRRRAAMFLYAEANRLRERADRYDAEADALTDQYTLNLGAEWLGRQERGAVSLRRHCA